jgi:hypothetical protein
VTTPLEIDINPVPLWPDVPDLAHPLDGPASLERIAFIADATTEGRAAIAMLVRLPDGRAVVAVTTWRLFNTAARGIAASPHRPVRPARRHLRTTQGSARPRPTGHAVR